MSAHVVLTSAQTRRAPSWRLIWMLPAGAALLLGLNAGLLLFGLPAPITTERLPEVHGMLLALGFVATLVSLERATALDRWYGYSAPALLGASGLLLVATPIPLLVGKSVMVAGMAAFTLVYLPLWRRQYDAPLLTQLLGAALGLSGAIIWLGHGGMPQVFPWLIGFLVLTIAAERVELARITMGAKAGSRILAFGWAVTLVLVVGVALPAIGAIALGAILLTLTVWLAQHDVARHTIRTTGVTRYMAACILAGYVWLAVAGVLLLFGDPGGSVAYDAVIHAVLLGYTFSMIMAHATTILPAVLRIDLPYRVAFWVPAVLLQIALIVRLWIGDGLGFALGRQLGGALGVVALLLFVATALVSAILGKPRTARNTRAERISAPKSAGDES